MSTNTGEKLSRHKLDILIAAIIWVAAFAVFWLSPVRQMTDSKYSMLLSQSLIDHGSFALDSYALPRRQPHIYEYYVSNGDDYQLEQRNGHLFCFFPQGGAVLSVPFVKLMNLAGVLPVNKDGTYNAEGEILIQSLLAAILMGALAGIFFLTARLLLPRQWSILVALGGSLGTQVWSTASRGIWSDTWGLLLLGLALFILLGQELKKFRMHPMALATLLAWAYFSRPTYSIAVAAVALYLLFYYRRSFLPFLFTGAAWLAGFVVYSWINYRNVLPSYYLIKPRFDVFWLSVAGNLFSPGRGLLLYVPVLLFVVYGLWRWRESLICRRLVALVCIVAAAQMIVVGGFVHWWGGWSFGPRLTTSLVPWLVLLAIIVLRAGLDWERQNSEQRVVTAWALPLAAGAVLLAASIFVNARGATSLATWDWNDWVERGGEYRGARLWDWRYPQFLAGMRHPPAPESVQMLHPGTSVDFGKSDADALSWYGWSGPETNFRWSDESEAAIVFGFEGVGSARIRVKVVPFLSPGLVERQRLRVRLNNRQIGDMVLTDPGPQAYELTIPDGVLSLRNELVFDIPDAASPQLLGVNNDPRKLGIALYSIDFYATEAHGK